MTSRKIRVKYADASAFLRVFLRDAGAALPLDRGEVASSQILQVECARAIERLRLTGIIDDGQASAKVSEAADILGRFHLAPVDARVVEVARRPFGINVRAIDALHIATAQVLAAESGEPVEFW